MSAVLLDTSEQQLLHNLEEQLDVFLVAVDPLDPSKKHMPAAAFADLGQAQLASVKELEQDLGCLLLAYQHE